MGYTHKFAQTQIPTNTTRDDRYKTIVRQQLGENGLTLIVNITTLFMMTLVILIFIMFGLFTVQNTNQTVLDKPALLMASTNTNAKR